MTERWGITVPFEGVPLTDQRSLFEALPDLGYTDVWSSEANATDAFTPLALASVWAPSLRLGTAIVPVYTRGPATLAMSAATMAAAAPGRFVLGVGTSSNVIVERWNSLPFEEPYKRVRDTVRFLRQALTGEKVRADYDTFSVRGFTLGAVPERVPPVLVAALRPGMLRLAGREADGAILNWLSAEDVRTVAPIVREFGDDKEIVARIFAVPDTDPDTARGIGRWAISAYLNVPVYRAFHEWLGREELGPMWKAWEEGDRKGALAAIPDSVVDELVVHGPAEHCRERIGAYVEAGVDTPVIAPIGPPGTDPAAVVRALAPRG
ncbi:MULTISPECIES: LLM class F420-dependent oxidoreductase [unclassified Nocardiopsis]|uniref:LLM class F420-dependent oxidoreductase n=1 Tax=unclassified Nocardiopsis TaxID=2649073 RepID=UPI00066B7159|nr:MULTISPECIES: LLM class F420-dependent oxidoreductase [unclassified Nocardiopsis]MBQ1080515.1 LLM class F420-dependent oxidoreductase [Nocardiopsis sp. B62]